jgi:tRNA (uracil-5-)-methyltransferase TRM9
LIYVWAIEQDELSKRKVSSDKAVSAMGVDLVVPWVMSKARSKTTEPEQDQMKPQVLNRYYHMFAKGELRGLVEEAAQELGLHVGCEVTSGAGVEIVQDGWERSNYYVELRLWNLENKAQLS